jgi:hypothetical protein
MTIIINVAVIELKRNILRFIKKFEIFTECSTASHNHS